MAQSIRSILIVGGGTSGWITAAFLNRFLDPARCRITLIESAALGTIGVGEATVPPLVGLLRLLQIPEDEFLRECHATYKLGIKFPHWNHAGNAEGGAPRDALPPAWHPFGHIGAALVENVPLFHHWLRDHRAGVDGASFTSYSLQALLGDMNRAPRSLRDASEIIQTGSYAYHLDARAFAAYLAKIATRRGVEYLVDDVRHVDLDESGRIREVQTRESGALKADLYIDCSGFAGLLIEQALGDRYIDWSDALLCDRAVVLPLPAARPMPPYTQATALTAGWTWKIPLSHRVGCGYVYSSKFLSQDEATAELLAHAGADPARSNPGHLRMRIGRRANFWVNNCVSVGLAAGFLEPLESTGIYLIQRGVEQLLDHFPDADFSPELARSYNARMAEEFEQVRDFIILHYLLNRREDTEFWRANRALRPPDSLAGTLAYYDATGIVDWQARPLFRETSFYSIAAGFGRLPSRHHAMADQADAGKARRRMDEIRARNQAQARLLPDHAELIDALNASGAPRA